MTTNQLLVSIMKGKESQTKLICIKQT